MIDIQQPLTLLGGISPATFMQEYWQKKPLLIRQAIPHYTPPINLNGLKKLARQDDVESRLVWRDEQTWNLERGPFARFPRITEENWTLLVQSVDLHHDKIAQLMQQFRFIPDARLDDVMISYASLGGGVGPHFDTYDVFLLQGVGQRQWRISTTTDKTLIPDLPCRILKNFTVEHEWILEPGDMLYLPPQCAHDGIAVSDECMTISIGFRTQTMANLARCSLEAIADHVSAHAGMGYGAYAQPPLPNGRIKGDYHDKQQKATTTPAQIPPQMIKKTLQALTKIQFDTPLVARALGVMLSEPNQLALFEPSFPLDQTLADYIASTKRYKLCLDKASRILYHEQEIYMNGECFALTHDILKTFANTHAIRLSDLQTVDSHTIALLQEWLDAGWIHCLKA